MKTDVVARFWSKVDVRGPDECWLWTAGRKVDGYGVFNAGGRIVGAHRFAYELAHGELPPGVEVAHKCDNAPCCNARHLRAVPHIENMADVRRGGYTRTGTPLTDAERAEVRRRAANGQSRTMIAGKMGLSYDAVVGVLGRRTR